MSDIRNIRNISETLFPISPGQGFAGAIGPVSGCIERVRIFQNPAGTEDVPCAVRLLCQGIEQRDVQT
jgi:hypothetical protein